MTESLSVDAFNGLLGNFISELRKVFPDNDGLEIYEEEFLMVSKANARAPVQLFMNALSPYGQLVMEKNPALFEKPINLGKNLNLKTLWTSDLSESTRSALFEHVFTLYIVGLAVTSMPPEILSSIEKAARDVATKVENGEPLDFASLMSGMSGMLAGGFGNLAGNDETKRLM